MYLITCKFQIEDKKEIHTVMLTRYHKKWHCSKRKEKHLYMLGFLKRYDRLGKKMHISFCQFLLLYMPRSEIIK